MQASVEILAAVVAAVGALAWLFRLEGRVNTQAQQHEQMREDLRYVRDRIDRAINGRHE